MTDQAVRKAIEEALRRHEWRAGYIRFKPQLVDAIVEAIGGGREAVVANQDVHSEGAGHGGHDQ